MRFRLGTLALLTVLAVAWAPSASHAETGLVGYFKFPFPNNVLAGVGVNHSGVGGAAPGDVFVSGVSGGGTDQLSALGIFKSHFPPDSNGNPASGDIAVDQATGDLYYADEVRTASGALILRHGFDVVRTGPHDSNVDAQQRVTVVAGGGTWTLSCCFSGGALVTKPLPYDATAAEVETAVNELIAVNEPNSSATVTGGPGSPTGTNPYVITFDGGEIAGDEADTLSVDGSKLSGSFTSLTNVRLASGGAVEICTPEDVCSIDACSFKTLCNINASFGHDVGGALSNPTSIALAPPSAPNAGNLLVADQSLRRVSEFAPSGGFIRAFGWDVNAHGPNDSLAHEEQTLTINATGGKFSLSLPIRAESSFGGPPTPTTGATGIGSVTSGSSTITNVATTTGDFAIGEIITGTGIPAGTTIVGVASGELTLSAPAAQSAPAAELTGDDIDFDAPASQVEAALNALPSVGGIGGSVAVTGANGGPYTITFGGTLGGDNLPVIGRSAAGLTGGSQSATIATVVNGGAFEVCVEADGDVCKAGEQGNTLGRFNGKMSGIAEDSSGAVYVVDAEGSGASNMWVQKLTPSGSSFVPSLFGTDEVQKLTVNAGSGQFRLSLGSQQFATTGTGNLTEGSNVITGVVTQSGSFTIGETIQESPGNTFYIPGNTVITAVGPTSITMSKPARLSFKELNLYSNTPYVTPDLPFNASPGAVESALNALPSIAGAGGSVSVSDGVGDPGGNTPYTITFSGGRFDNAGISQIKAVAGTTPLSGGTGPGADQAMVVTHSEGGPRGIDARSTPVDVAIDHADNVQVAKAFPIADAKCGDGELSPPEVRVQLFDTVGNLQDTSAPCIDVRRPIGGGPDPNLAVDPANGDLYMAVSNVNFQAGNEPFYGAGGFIFVLADTGSQPILTLDPPSDIGSTGVTISGTINPQGPPSASGRPNPTNTKYRIEFRKEGESEWTVYAPDSTVGSGGSPVPFSIGVSGLTPKTAYEIRTVVSKFGFPTLFGTPQTVITAGARPTIDSFTSSNVAASSADLEAVINPLGTDTTYRFEYGKTPAYGLSTPETPIGAAQVGVPVADHLEGLEATVYHFRVVATNEFGTTTSSDQTFTFYPESCPNAIVRAQTGSGTLPDCRAYELVSPGDAGAASLTIGGPNSPYASPSRLSFFGFFGTIPGPWNPQNVLGDLYVASRSASGWSTHYVGIPADWRPFASGPPNGGVIIEGLDRPDPIWASTRMDRFLDWDGGNEGIVRAGAPRLGSMAPYVWGADGSYHGRLPTNVAEVPGGEADLREGGFNGDITPSPDFTHFFFSSANVVFAPDGQTSGNGSVYDNDLETGSMTIASRLPNGDHIPPEAGDQEDDYFILPAASTDGSHILIAATGTAVCGEPTCGAPPNERVMCFAGLGGGQVGNVQRCPQNLPSHLYMRASGITYDVSRGAVVQYDGMVRDGSKVYFTTEEDLTTDGSDDDSSIDLYMWSEAGDTVTRISAGQGLTGNTDGCNAEWIAGCGVEVVPSLDGSAPGPSGFEEPAHGGETDVGFSPSDPTDNSIAGDSGDIYFYSPEQFVPAKGIPGRRNLYVFHEGQIEFVATLDADEPTTRFQVTPDGGRAAFITASKLTTYENAGYEAMYTYTPETGAVVCVSCTPTGAPPTDDVFGSQNGLFMSDDGRTFFQTETAVLPSDTNGLIDVYEYVDGRPQLISSGVANIQTSALGEAGLIGVSADGTDVYFASFDKLVEADQNGQLLRFYDARTGGGFPESTSPAPCAAADECHGPPNQTPALPTIGSGANVGPGGNHAKAKKRKTRKGMKSQKKRKKRRNGKHRRASSSPRGGQR